MLADACSAQLSDFFKRRCAEKKAARLAAKEALPQDDSGALMAPFAFISLPDRRPASPPNTNCHPDGACALCRC